MHTYTHPVRRLSSQREEQQSSGADTTLQPTRQSRWDKSAWFVDLPAGPAIVIRPRGVVDPVGGCVGALSHDQLVKEIIISGPVLTGKKGVLSRFVSKFEIFRQIKSHKRLRTLFNRNACYRSRKQINTNKRLRTLFNKD